MIGEFQLRSAQFRREREQLWNELEALLSKLERHGPAGLAPYEALRLPALYQGALSSLEVARSISLDHDLIHFLENLSARAYLAVHGSLPTLTGKFFQFIRVEFPGLVRELRWELLVASLATLLGIATAFALTTANSENYYDLVPSEMAAGREPDTSREELANVLVSGGTEANTGLAAFATFLFTNNSRVAILCFAVGFAGGVPTLLILYFNGLVLGALAALYSNQGLSWEFWAWVLPHGITEIFAICLAGAAGLASARSLVFPGVYRRLDRLSNTGKKTGSLVLGAILLLFLAALIEGFLRQMVHNQTARYTMAVGSLIFWIAYLAVWPQLSARPSPREATLGE